MVGLGERAIAAIPKLTIRHAGRTIVLVSHTAVNRVILLAILGLGSDRFWRLRQDHCAINVFKAESGAFTLVAQIFYMPPQEFPS